MKRRIFLMMTCLLLIVSTIIAPVSASAATAKIFKLNTNANLRDPDDYTNILTYMKKGTKVLWTGKTKKSFYLVATTDGKVGYVFRDYLDEYGAVSMKAVYKTTASAKLYKKASTSSHKVATIGSGKYVLVYAIKGGWAYVKTTSGKGGFMKTSVLKKAS